MSPQLHRRIREVFDLALERPESERVTFVHAACCGEPDVFEAVTRLLEAHRGACSFLEENAPRPHQVGRYRIVGELGRGSMGIVYEAIDPIIGRKIALKVIHLDALIEVAGPHGSLERLFREASSAGALLHPNIVVAFDVGQEGSAAFFAMEKVDGPSLEQVLASGRNIEPAQALELVRQIGLALDFAHQRGVIHRDIKPANILLADGVTAKVADFSIAKIVSAQSLTATGMVWGTPSYMSPEQIEGRPLDGAADQFSLAVLAYELLTGAKPFQADSLVALANVIVYAPRPSARAANPALPPAVDEVFYRALARFPKERFWNCEELAAALKEAAGPLSAGKERAAPGPETPAEIRRSRRRFRYIAGVAAIVPGLVLGFLRYESVSQRKHAAPAPPASLVSARPPDPAPVAKPDASARKPTALSTLPPASAAAREEPALRARAATSETTPVPAPAPSGEKATHADQNVPVSVSAVDAAAQARQFYEQARNSADTALMRRAAEMGEPRAMVAMGELSENNQDQQGALEWFRKAADAGDASGMLHLGAIYEIGAGVPQDDKAAAYWYQKASDEGNSAAMYDLGAMYENGSGVPEDLNKAKLLYQRAAENGNSEAQAALLRLKGN
jgi:serine/threonine protein kinase